MNNLKHVMVDLETFATSADAAIVAIGAVLFDPDQGRVSENPNEWFYQVIDLAKSRLPGKIDPATVMWWLGQDDDARAALTKEKGMRLGHALDDFAFWLCNRGCTPTTKSDFQIWANDPDFDLCILQSAYERYGRPIPWSFRNARSMRTMCRLASEFHLVPDDKTRGGTKHNALDDAIHQAKVVTAIKQEMRKRMGASV